MIADSAAINEDYAKRAVELGHKILSSVEHGWQGYYYETFELAKKYGLKFIFGAEAYWVVDRFEKDRTNSHIVLLARNETGRKAINRILSEANETGYYFRPRVDLDLLLSLPPNDVFITTACVAFWQYEDIEKIVSKLHNHFKNNLMLEIQNHDTLKQLELNSKILKLSQTLGIKMIAGLDSHYIYPEQAGERDYVLTAKNIHYENEEGWYMDYPDDQTVMNRFLKQGVFTREQIQEAMDNTNICLEFEDIEFNTDIKLPTLFSEKSQDERNSIYSRLITKQFKEYMNGIPAGEYKRYYEGVKSEVQVYKNTGMVDYPLIDYAIVKRAIEKGGIITNSGRGSGVGYFTNTLCGFSKVDRFTSPIKLYPERFISESRILETKSLPDLDMNCGNPEIFAEAQEEILGKDHAAPMIAFGTFRKKAAFKLYAKAKNLDFEIANEISKQLEKYDNAVKYADDDEKDEINIYDYVDEQYHSYITASQPYWGIVSDKKKAPCAYLLYQGSIQEDIGLIKCKSDSTKKEYITTVIDGAIAEKYKFLKNDLLKVDVVLLIDKIYKRIKQKSHTVNELMELIKNDQSVWDIYARGLTMGINQCEKDSTTKKVMKYRPQNVSELAAFIAAIRPAFKSMYSKFESREQFSYGIKAFDKILQTPEFPQSYILYQEQTMNTLNYAGFPIDECYGIIKAIAKKHPEKVRPLKSRFIDGFKERIIEEDHVSEDEAAEMSAKVWQIISDSCGYGFNSAHAYCMALDSLYCAYLKAHYPYEFYEVLMQHYSDKGDKDKVARLRMEMSDGFGIQEGDYLWGNDNRKFVADAKNHVIYPSLLSIKGLSQGCANELYKLSQKSKYDSFYQLVQDILQLKSMNKGKLSILSRIGYFRKFAKAGKIERFMEAYEALYERSQFDKSSIPSEYQKYIQKNCTESEKQYRDFDYEAALKGVWNDLEDVDLGLHEKLKYEMEYQGQIRTVIPAMSRLYAFVQEYECRFVNPKLILYFLSDGHSEIVKVKRKKYDDSPINAGDLIKVVETNQEGKWFNMGKDENGDIEWEQDRESKETILKKWSFVR